MKKLGCDVREDVSSTKAEYCKMVNVIEIVFENWMVSMSCKDCVAAIPRCVMGCWHD